jgi:hypothetical protein
LDADKVETWVEQAVCDLGARYPFVLRDLYWAEKHSLWDAAERRKSGLAQCIVIAFSGTRCPVPILSAPMQPHPFGAESAGTCHNGQTSGGGDRVHGANDSPRVLMAWSGEQ